MSQNVRQAASDPQSVVPSARPLIGKPGTNIGGAGEHNRRVVMHVLRVNGSMSRAQISRGTGLAPQTVSNIIEELEADGLVIAAQPVRGARGQPATPYSLAPDGAFALGMQIDQHRVRAVAVDLLGNIVARAEAALAMGGLQANLPLILATTDRASADLRARCAPTMPPILGLGLAMPVPTGVHAVLDDPWMVGLTEDHPLAKAIAKKTGLTVNLHHDASAAAMAERLNGRAVGLEDFVLIFVSFGIGAGIYARGEAYRGHHHLAGELGQVRMNGGFGAFDTLERCAGLGRLFADLGLSPSQPDLYEKLGSALTARHPAVLAWTDIAAQHLAWAVEMIEYVIDPSCIVIGGQMPEQLMHSLMAAIINARRPDTPERRPMRPNLLQGSSDLFTVAAGAAADPIARAFDPSFSAMMKVVGG